MRGWPLASRFWARVVRSDGCWTWTGHVNGKGYGMIRRGVGLGNTTVHRLSWEMHKGPIPDGLLVCHSCDNPPCVNPAHLFLGTTTDNMRDMVAKGRSGGQRHPHLVRGERNGAARLTVQDVLAIRTRLAAGETQSALARSFNVSRGTIRLVGLRVTWDHVA